MIRFLLVVALLVGQAAYYGESWDWDRIAENHGLEVPAGLIPVATPDCYWLGHRADLRIGDGQAIPAYVADCSWAEHYDGPEDTIVANSVVVEVPYWLAMETFEGKGFAPASLVIYAEVECVGRMEAMSRVPCPK